MYEVSHIGLVVKDAAKSGEFYREILGCSEVDSYRDSRVALVFLRAGTQTIELVQYMAGETEPRRAGVVDHIAFQVRDIEAEAARLRQRGVRLLFDAPREMAGGKKIFFFAGPDGERLEFVQEAAC
ncbi:MAG TPA: VOC family protein [Selenomonadales bacterium]|nr:VOC family protein [Selenomonadales bacterium]